MKFDTFSILLSLVSHGMATWKEAHGKEITYTSVNGYFLQDDDMTNATAFDYVSSAQAVSLRFPSCPPVSLLPWERIHRLMHIATGRSQFWAD